MAAGPADSVPIVLQSVFEGALVIGAVPTGATLLASGQCTERLASACTTLADLDPFWVENGRYVFGCIRAHENVDRATEVATVSVGQVVLHFRFSVDVCGTKLRAASVALTPVMKSDCQILKGPMLKERRGPLPRAS
jgi:hypothetical protein